MEYVARLVIEFIVTGLQSLFGGGVVRRRRR
jgi:hypothetical protein